MLRCQTCTTFEWIFHHGNLMKIKITVKDVNLCDVVNTFKRIWDGSMIGQGGRVRGSAQQLAEIELVMCPAMLPACVALSWKIALAPPYSYSGRFISWGHQICLDPSLINFNW